MFPQSWRLPTAGSIACLLLLRSLQKVTDYQFIVLAGGNATAPSETEPRLVSIATVTSWVYTCRYLLPVLGGLLACWLGHVRLLQVGGGVMLVTAAVMSVAIYLDSWRGDSPIALVACLLLPVLNGLVMPNGMQGVLSKRTQPRHRTMLCALVYISSAAGLFAGVHISRLHALLGRHYALVCILVAAAYCSLALCLSLPCARAAARQDGFPEADEDAALAAPPTPGGRRQVQLPTRNRLRRCFLVFSSLIPFLLGLCDDRATVFKAELRYLKNDSATAAAAASGDADGGSGARETMTATLLSIGLVLVNLAMVASACLVRSPNQRLPIRPRLLGGLCLQTALEVSLACVSSGAVQLPRAALDAFYTAASMVDATSSVLVMVAAYEIADGFERDAARPLILGVMLTVWGLGTVASRLLYTAVCQQIMLPPRPQLQFPLYHGTLALLLLVSLFYARFCALPLAGTLAVTYRWQARREAEEPEVRETSPLLEHPPA